jgi:hypothetical protein
VQLGAVAKRSKAINRLEDPQRSRIRDERTATLGVAKARCEGLSFDTPLEDLEQGARNPCWSPDAWNPSPSG